VSDHHVGGHLHRVLRQAHRGHRQGHAPDLAALLSQVRPPPRAVAVVVTVLLLPAIPRRHSLLQKRRTLPHGGRRRGRFVALLSPQTSKLFFSFFKESCCYMRFARVWVLRGALLNEDGLPARCQRTGFQEYNWSLFLSGMN
jgi:hypothetical protein